MTTWVRRRLSERRHDERGAILILSALFLVVMVLAAALALDIGLEGVDKRVDHRVADLAALDGARALSDAVLPCVDATRFAAATLAANQSALRNGFNPLDSGNSLSLDVGKWDPVTKTYTQVDPGVACTANAVHVVVGSVTHFKFQPFSQSLSAEAVATQFGVVQPTPPPTTTTTTPPSSSTPWGGIKLGSFLANMDSTQAALLNEVVCQALTGVSLPNVGALPVSCPKFNLSAASWQGLGKADITMDELGKALAANGVIGSPGQVGGATVQADQLFKATGDALTQKGDTADAQIMYNLGQGVSGSRAVSIPAMVPQVQGQQNSAVASTQPVNVADLVIGSATAQIANGTNAVAVIDTGLSVPNVSGSSLNLAVIQGKRSYYGPAPASVTTSQLSSATSTKSGLDLQLNNLPVSIAGITGATLSGSVNVSLTGAGASATMSSVACGTSLTVNPVQLNPYHTSVTGTGLTLNIPLQAPLSVGVTAAQDVTGGSGNKTFTWQSQFSDPGNPNADNPWHLGSTSLRFNQLTYDVTVNGSLPIGTTLAAIQSAVASQVNSTVAQFDGPLDNIFRELGLFVGGSDVWATQLANFDSSFNPVPCPSASTTTTVPAPTTTTTTALSQSTPVLVK